jgi:hypothetical protein
MGLLYLHIMERRMGNSKTQMERRMGNSKTQMERRMGKSKTKMIFIQNFGGTA